MKILHIFHHGNLVNGVDATTLTLIRALRRQGVDTCAVVPTAGDVTRALDASAIPYRISDLPCCTSPAPMAELRYFARAAKRADEIKEWIRTDGIDLVHLNTGHLVDGAVAAACAGVPAVWHIHAPFEVDFARYSRHMEPGGYAWLLSELGSHILAVSDDVRASLVPHIPADQVTTLYNGLDVNDLDRRAAAESVDLRATLGIEPSAPLVLGVGRICAQKDFATFVHVAHRVVDAHPEVCFAIAGPSEDHELTQALQALINELRLDRRVLLLGPRSDVPSLLAQADAFLSTAVFEGQGLAALEAMAQRRPVVAMACIGLRECIVPDKDGLLVAPGDVVACAQAVLRVLRDPDLSRSLGRKGRESVLRRFSADASARIFLDIANRCDLDVRENRRRAAQWTRGLLHNLHHATNRLDKQNAAGRSMAGRMRRAFARLLDGSNGNERP